MKKIIIFFIFIPFFMGCATISSIEKHYESIELSDGVDRKEVLIQNFI